jgi:hypothetical protein
MGEGVVKLAFGDKGAALFERGTSTEKTRLATCAMLVVHLHQFLQLLQLEPKV